MKVYADPLLAESIPDGTFGGARLTKAQRRRAEQQAAEQPVGPRVDPQAAAHRAALEEAIYPRRRRAPRKPRTAACEARSAAGDR